MRGSVLTALRAYRRGRPERVKIKPDPRVRGERPTGVRSPDHMEHSKFTGDAHALMMKDLVRNNGRYRSGGVGIFNGQNEKRMTVKGTVNQKKILESVKKNPHVTLDELSKKIGIFAQEHCSKCKEASRSRHAEAQRCRQKWPLGNC